MLNDEGSDRAADRDSYRDRITNFSNEFDLGLFLHIVRRSLVWIALCLLLAAAGAFIYLRYTQPTYASSVLLQLGQSNQARTVLNMNDMMEDHSLQADVQLLRSKFFVAKAVALLPLKVSYFFSGQILTEEHYKQSFYQVEDLEVLDAGVRGRPVVLELNDAGKLLLSYTMGGQRYVRAVEPGRHFTTPHFSAVVRILGGKPWPKEQSSGTNFFIINDPAALTAQYASHLSVAISDPDAKTITISYKDNNAMLARDLCQAMADAYIQYDVERKSESAENILRFIEVQKDTVFQQLHESEMKLQEIKRDNRVANMADLTPLLLQRSDEYEDEMLKLRMEDNLLVEVQHAAMQDEGHMNVYQLIPLLTGSEFASDLEEPVKTLRDLLQRREAMVFEATTRNESVRQLDHQIELQQGLILESITTMRARIASRMKDYKDKLEEYDRRFSAMPAQEMAYARVERLFNINEKYYTQLLEKDIEYRINKAGLVPENRVLESAILPTTPISPDRGLVILSYLLSGLIIGMLIVLVRYLLHNEITSLYDIAKLSNASVGILGMVPRYKKDIPRSQLIVDRNPKSLIAESFRSVRTNMQFMERGHGPKVVAITSTISGEGKTFVAINLAGIINFNDKRVVILDLDMRKPKIHLGFGVPNTMGMSTLLIGKDELDACIRHSSLPGLDFITAGPIPPNPSELILGDRMARIIGELKERYDVIMIDTPPVGLVTDGIPIIQAADIPIYVFRADRSRKSFIQNMDRLMNENHISRLSAVLNGVDVDRNKYGYSYGYGHGYGYGYGYGDSYYEEGRNRGKDRKGFMPFRRK